MAITADTLRLEQHLRDTLEAITDAQTRDLVRAWATAWDEVAPDLTATLLEMLVAGDRVTRAQLLRSERLRKVLTIIAAKLDGLTATSRTRIIGDLQQVIDTAGGAQASVIDSQLPPNAGELVDFDTWSRVDEKQITAIVTRSTQQITALHKPLSREAYNAVRRELIRGVAAGSNPRAVASRMVKRAEGRFNGGLNRALVISRTEILDAHRTAAQLGQTAHADVLAGWTWGAKLDSRTCPSCWGQHGSLHSLDDPGPLDHQQGRCARIPATKSWADLGFDIEEPPSVLPDAEAQFAGLSVADQKAILGPARHDAWARGEFPMSDWSVKRTTDGWRDSYAPASPNAGRARSAA
jgi:SPP1 gp7 family putative phage head morphogenesis protein